MVQNKALRITFAASLFLTCVARPQETTDLFQPVETGKGPSVTAASEVDESVLQSRLVTLDLERLEPTAESTGQAIRFNLFDDVTAEFELARAARPTLGGLHWFGREAGDTIERAVLSIVEGRTNGTLTVGTRFFRIEHVAGPVHRIEELRSERDAFGEDAVVPPGSLATEPLAK